MKKLLLLLIAGFPTSFARAQETTEKLPMNPDRPSQGNGARVVTPGFVQFETGLTFQRDATNSQIDKEYRLPELQVRIGAFKFAELRIASQITRTVLKTEPVNLNPAHTNTGLDGLLLGTKIKFWNNRGWLPAAALQTEFRLPVGSAGFKGNKIEPKVRLNFRNDLSERFSLNYNVGVEWEENTEGSNKHTYSHVGLYTLALNYALSDNLSIFIEPYATLNNKDLRQSLDAGLAYKIRPNLQVDIYGGGGLSEEAPDFFVSTGLSFRLPR